MDNITLTPNNYYLTNPSSLSPPPTPKPYQSCNSFDTDELVDKFLFLPVLDLAEDKPHSLKTISLVPRYKRYKVSHRIWWSIRSKFDVTIMLYICEVKCFWEIRNADEYMKSVRKMINVNWHRLPEWRRFVCQQSIWIL